MDRGESYAKKIVITVCTVCAVVLSANLFIRKNSELENPVFLQHFYYFSNFDVGHDIRLKYISNKSDDRTIKNISFPQWEELKIKNVYNWDDFRYGIYDITTVCVEPILDGYSEIPEKTLTKATVKYSDGYEETVDIGKIILKKDAPSKELLNFSSSYASSSGDSCTISTVSENCTLVDIYHAYKDDLNDEITIKINGNNPSLPMQFYKGDIVKTETVFNTPSGLNRYNEYDINVELIINDENGDTSSKHLYNINYSPEFTQRTVKAYLEMIGAIPKYIDFLRLV